MKHSFIDKYSQIDSFLNKIDPRIKVASFLIFILSINFTKPTSLLSFILYGLILAVLILLSKVPAVFIFKRSLIIIPFVLTIAIFIPFFKKGEIAGAYSFGTLRLTITYDGLIIFWNVLIKAYLSILCMILLTATTKFSNLLKALQNLRCPQLIIMIISFMYRYIFLITDELMKMQQAKDSRSIANSNWLRTKTNASMLGTLFIRSYERAESVYLAMQARGFSGDIRILNNFCLKNKDLAFLLVIIILLAGANFLGR